MEVKTSITCYLILSYIISLYFAVDLAFIEIQQNLGANVSLSSQSLAWKKDEVKYFRKI